MRAPCPVSSAVAWTLGALLLAVTLLPAHADSLEAYVRPVGPNFVSPCPLTHWIFDPCTGVESLASVPAHVEIGSDPCEPVLLIGSWGWTFGGCRAYRVTGVSPTEPICDPQPKLRAAHETTVSYSWSWDPVPCVNSYDVVSFHDSIETAPSMEQFHCALNDVQSTSVAVNASNPQPGELTALLVRGQQGALAADHYGPASSGEPRRPPNDCALDLTGAPDAPPRAPHQLSPEIVP